MSFFDEVRRRNVHRAALAYLAGMWLLIQIVETLFPVFGLTDAVVRGVVIVLAIGCVPAVILSWVFEWTPQGLMRDADLTAETPRTPTKYLDRAITITLVLAVAYFAGDKFVLDPARDAAEIEAAREEGRVDSVIDAYGDNSIAVLPFINLSSDSEQAYFPDGITEELLNLLARIQGSRVISRSTMFTFKGKENVVTEVAKKLNVMHVLEGSVRKAGNRVRITAQLIDGRTDTHLWSDTFDRTLDDIFAIQDEISARVVAELKLQLLDGPPTAEEIDPHAYELYLQARHIMEGEGRTRERIAEAEEKLQRVFEMEPDFVAGIWELARAIGVGTGAASADGPEEHKGRIRALVDRMVSLAPESSYTNAWQARIARYWEDDLQGWTRHLERAFADDPFNPPVLTRFVARFLLELGRTDEAFYLMRYIVSRDPACQRCLSALAYLSRQAGRHQEGAEYLESTLDWHEPRGEIYWNPGVAWTGENDQAFECLEKFADQQGSGAVGKVKTDLYAKLESDPRWQEFLEKHGQSDEDLSHIEFNPKLPAAVRAALAADINVNDSERGAD
jgi:TolB-like protein